MLIPPKALPIDPKELVLLTADKTLLKGMAFHATFKN